MMKTWNLSYLVSFMIAVLMVACGGGHGVPLGAFPDITATEGDAPITLKAPESKSPAAFVYSSSNPKVATVSGNTVTILQPGTTTITAAQPSIGSYNPTSTSALLTVKPRVCSGSQVNVGGVCVTSVTCIAPAINQNNVCVAPATAGNFVTQNGHSWMPVTAIHTWDNANSFCTNTTINGMTGWKLPTQFDLTELFASGAMNGQGWTLGSTWSSTAAAYPANTYVTVNLANGASQEVAASAGAYVTCMH
jgi:hypothetical protein